MNHNKPDGKISSIAFYGSRNQEGHIDDIWRLVSRLRKEGVEISVEKKLAEVINEAGFRLPIHNIKVCTRLPEDTDLAISVGGDGTFLRTARWLAGKEIPIVGVNTGHLGFLAENSAGNVEETVNLILSGDAVRERRLVLMVECDAFSPSDWPFALNEVAFMKGAASMIDIDINLDSFHLANYKADGLLVTTPTGSTAYNLSVGGPILAPTLQNIVLSPIAPHTLTLRPVVVGGDSEILAHVESRAHEFRLSIDGRQIAVPCGMPVKIRKAPHFVVTLRRPGDNFASTMRSKLFWGH